MRSWVLAAVCLGVAASLPVVSGAHAASAAPQAPSVRTQSDRAPADPARKGERPFYDVPGRLKDAVFGSVEDAINDWFRGIVSEALAPVFDLFARTLFFTPDLASNPRVLSLWKVALGLADAGLIVLAVFGGGAVMVSGVEGRLTAKELLPRLVGAAAAANLSLLIVSQATRLSNAVAQTILGVGEPNSVADDMTRLVSNSLTNPFFALLGLVVVVLGLFVVVVFVLRVAVLVVLVVGAPLMLICHALPHIEGVARAWWKATAAALLVPIAQALVLAAALRIVLTSELLGLSSGGLIDLIVVCCLLYLLFKIPLAAAGAVRTGAGGRTWQRTKTVLIQTARAVSPA